ncbi:Protein kinase domain [Arabidopsis thaliana x Arabidopsis arenosa]|uniref:non-specific serine/threonine protein kinase n=1 Tax=Arabidopsis thaliana x Arabidopsis arenosa TaxID=1240361 RepID=A0A8T2CHT4_9BRAS|nr:Protein kinase domain [Arabidopsis thaliana x Arabidopsis arenosa]
MRNWENPFTLACNTALKKNLPSCIFLIIFISVLCPVAMSQVVVPDSDADCLLKFKDTLANGSEFTSWDPSTSPCQGNTANWFGVLCSNYVWGLQLEGMGLAGKLNLDPLVPMKNLRTISFMNNNFNGPMPQVKRFTSLKSLYLSNNRFSGEIPADAFRGMPLLKKILLANNAFRGTIPSSLASLPMLLELRLNGNQFQGQIPSFQQKDLKLASFENNDLDGPIPESLRNMDPGSFAGNKDLCDAPLSPCSPSSPGGPVVPVSPVDPKSTSPPTGKKTGSFYTLAIILIVIGIILVIIALVFCFVQTRRRNLLSAYPSAGKERIESYNYHQSANKNNKPAESVVNHTRRGSTPDPGGRLLFVRDDIQRFGLQDLLRASAEVLGSGTFGASYKAAISSGQTLVVKRYKHMNNVGRDEFHEHMRRLGRLNHPNILPLVAYYYRREEKLLVTQFMPNSSLASHLHANNSAGLDWITRLKIIKGVAKGLSYLFDELPTLTIPHGHIKSSNIVLDESFEPLLTDYALRPVMSSEHAHNFMTAYKSPEYRPSKGQIITKKTDVWCFGVLILEVLTGRFPENYLTQGYDSNMSLVTWVNDMVKEKKTGDVFDKEMKGKKNCKAEMINLLKIGLRCCEEEEERRMDMREVVEMIEMLREGESEDDFGSMDHRGTHNNLYSSMLLDDDDFGFSMNR